MKTANRNPLSKHALIGLAGVLVALAASIGHASPVTSKQAAAALRGWLKADAGPLDCPLGNTIKTVTAYPDASGVTLFYVIILTPAGFVVMGADDLVEPVIAFAPGGRFEASSTDPLGALVAADLGGRMTQARGQGAVALAPAAVSAREKWQHLQALDLDGGPGLDYGLSSISDVRVAPLVQTAWSQTTAGGSACYNYYTPPYGEGAANNYPCGCVATAMAQLMRYYQHPVAGVGTASFQITVDGGPTWVSLRGGDGAGGPYAWASMPSSGTSATTAQRQAIGALTADAGATVNMDYAAGGSGAVTIDSKGAFVNTFQYSAAVEGYNNGSNIGAGLTGMVNPNLDAHFPVLFGITGAPGGHAVVGDGYGYNLGTMYHHLNLGWGGADTAWYSLPTIDTSQGTFTTLHSCVYNVYVTGTGEIISGRVVNETGTPIAGATVTATRTGGGSYTATTDSKGIYALAKVPSASQYTLLATNAGYGSASRNVTTGTSADRAASSGNYWGADFTLVRPTTAVDHFAWIGFGATQGVNTPFGVTIAALNTTNGPATDFVGTVSVIGYTGGVVWTNTVLGNISPNYYGNDALWTDGYSFTPNVDLRVTHVRSYFGSKVSIWTEGGTLVATRTVAGTSGVWTETPLISPVTLTGGVKYRIGVYYPVGPYYFTTIWPSTFPYGTIDPYYYNSYGDAFPTDVYQTGAGPLVDLRYTVGSSNLIFLSPTVAGPFVAGVWSGNLTIFQTATNMVLKADDGAGHIGSSAPLNVVSALAPSISVQPQDLTVTAGQNATFSLTASGTPAPGYYWWRGQVPIDGATAPSYTLTNAQPADSGVQFSCLVSNASGSVTSRVATLTVTQPQPPQLVPSSLKYFADGQFQFTLSGATGATYEIQVSSNLVNWQPLLTLQMTNPTSVVLDTNVGLVQRFYRAQYLTQ